MRLIEPGCPRALYGEAAVGFASVTCVAPAPGRAVWGVRLGWLAQTALLVVQATSEDGFPWGTWAGSLNLFVWLVVTVYLGVRRPYRLVGLAVMPLAAVLLVVARAGGGTGIGTRSQYSNAFLVLHVGLVLVAFAGFTLAAALSAFYLWQERRLKRREVTILRRPAPSLSRRSTVPPHAQVFLARCSRSASPSARAAFADGEGSTRRCRDVATCLSGPRILVLRRRG